MDQRVLFSGEWPKLGGSGYDQEKLQDWLFMSNCLILVPARFGSSRFPGKPLAKIHQKTMIEYIIENCQNTGFDWAIVTDNDEIEAKVNSCQGNVIRVDDDVATGSERIALAYMRFYSEKKYSYIINVQGDEPLLVADAIKTLAKSHEQSPYDIYTAVKKRLMTEDDFQNPNVVKCVKSTVNGQCLYFSRSSIPYDRSAETGHWLQHIGLYSYRPEALLKFVDLPVSEIENSEKLEQLRALENGMTIGAVELDIKLIGVDTPEDIKKVEEVLSE